MSDKALKLKLTKEQKTGFVLLLVFSLLIISFGVLQIRNNLHKSFKLTSAIPLNIGEDLNSLDSLRLRDTDGDGLSDFDELFIYNTSPYLADTDSDGILDGQEVLQGTNPLCPKGQDCEVDISLTPAKSGGLIDTSLPPLVIAGVRMDAGLLSLGQVFNDPDKIRLLLIESGVSKQDVDLLSDEALLFAVEQYKLTNEQALQAQAELESLFGGAGAIESYNLTGQTNIPASTQSNNLEDTQSIRLMLLQNGIPQEALDKISDEQILEYMKESGF